MLTVRAARLSALLLALPCCDRRVDFDIPESSVAEAGDRATSDGGGDDTATEDGGPDGPHDCDDDDECAWAALHCDLLTGSCVECVVDDDCDTAGAPYCDRTLHRCVQCAVDQNCDDGFVCDSVIRHCRQRCDDDDDCPTGSHGCDERRRVCIACDDDDECQANDPASVCGIGGSACLACRLDEQCDGQLCDALTGQCVECLDTRDCPAANACDPRTLRCISR